MLTNFFGKSKPINTLILVVGFILLFSASLVTAKITFYWDSLLLLLITLGIVKFINERNNLTFDNSFTLLFFVILLGAFPKTMTLSSNLYTNITLLLFFRKLYSLQSNKNVYAKLFDAGLWLGVSFLIEPFSICFLLLLYLAIYLHNQITIRTLIIPLLGFSVPISLCFTYCFLGDNTLFFEKIFIWNTNYNLNLHEQTTLLFSEIIVGTLLIVAILLKTKKALTVNNDFKRSWILVIAHLIFACALILMVSEKNEVALLFLLFPAAIILANGLELYEKKLFSEVLMIVIVIATLGSIFL